MIRIEHADMLEAIPRLVAEGVVVDAVVTDPPYGLEFMNVAWDTMREGGTPRIRNEWGDFGFREHPRTAEEAGRVRSKKLAALEANAFEWFSAINSIMRPGAFLVAFGGTRTHHRVWCAIEDAGFVIQDTIMWLFGSGFPKRRDMLKPAFEPICLAYKPGGKRTMQVDECRIEGTGNKTFDHFAGDRSREQYRTGTTGASRPTDLGRWPANLVLSPDGGEYELRAGVTSEQRAELYRWLSENP